MDGILICKTVNLHQNLNLSFWSIWCFWIIYPYLKNYRWVLCWDRTKGDRGWWRFWWKRGHCTIYLWRNFYVCICTPCRNAGYVRRLGSFSSLNKCFPFGFYYWCTFSKSSVWPLPHTFVSVCFQHRKWRAIHSFQEEKASRSFWS